MDQIVLCTGCKIEKPITEFGKDSRRKEGIRTRCKKCESALYQKDAARIGKRDRTPEYRARRRVRYKVRSAQPGFLERMTIARRERQALMTEEEIERKRTYYREWGRKDRQTRRQTDPRAWKMDEMLRKAKERGRNEGREYRINKSDFPDWRSIDVCPVLGLTLRFDTGVGYRVDQSPTIDRIDNALGYIPGNVRIISWRANRIKSDASLQELESIVAYIRQCSAPS